MRNAVDFRKLNTMTISEPFLMPTTEEIIARLGNAKFLSKPDLCKGFHQVPMHPDAKHLTAFSCRYGKFQYKKMPFGLKKCTGYIPAADADHSVAPRRF